MSLLGPKFLAMIIFIIINLSTIFFIKSRTSIVIFLITSHLIAILLLSSSLSNYENFKELTLVLISFATITLALISNENPIYLNENRSISASKNAFRLIFLIIIFGLCAYSIFFLTSSITQVSVNAKKEIAEELYLKGYPKTDLEKKESGNFEDNLLYKSNTELSRLQKELPSNFLLKRFSDMILLVVAIFSSLLLLSRKKPNS